MKQLSLCALMMLLLLATSCTREKHFYTSAYHSGGHKPRPRTEPAYPGTKEHITAQATVAETPEPVWAVANDEAAAGLAAAAEASTFYSAPAVEAKARVADRIVAKQRTVNDFGLLECDIITFRTGDEVRAKVTEVSPTEIRYKRCDNLEGPVIIVKRADVFSIKYPNGSKDVFTESSPEPVVQAPPATKVVHRRTETLALVSLVVAGVGVLMPFGIIFGPAAIVLGIIGISRIRRNPEGLKGIGFAIAGMVLGTLQVLALALLLAFLY